jgi:3-oxoacyl-[acyl-carrier-protein] synthase-3
LTFYTTSRLISIGTAVPDRIVTNRDLEEFVDTTDEWISTRTGIRQRHLFAHDRPGFAWELGALAGRRALEKAGMSPAEVGGIICATFTPDYFFPSTACKIQEHLGCKGAFAFDIAAACTGFIYGLAIADAMIRSGQTKNILLVGAEVISRTLDWTDRTTCILFGDAAGAALLQGSNEKQSGLLSTYISSEGSLGHILSLPAFGEKRVMKMNGSEVFKNAVRMMSDATLTALSRASLSLSDIDLLVPHQANIRIIKAIAENLHLPYEKVVSNIDRYGNTSSASIPLALEEAWDNGRVKPGTLVAFTALGGGLTVGSAVMRF